MLYGGKKKKYFAILGNVKLYKLNFLWLPYRQMSILNKVSWAKSQHEKSRHEEVVTGNSTSAPPCYLIQEPQHHYGTPAVQWHDITRCQVGMEGWQAHLFICFWGLTSSILSKAGRTQRSFVNICSKSPSRRASRYMREIVLLLTYQDCSWVSAACS